MITYCIDTNAILDLCYRYYPKQLFTPIWDTLHASISAGLIRIIITEHIHLEVYEQAQIRRYDTAILDDFIDLLKVKIVPQTTYTEQLSDLSAELANITKIKPNEIAKNAEDLSNICVAILHKATVITAEQGTGKPITDPTYKRLKIPDTCNHYQLECNNWIPLFEFIGFMF